MAFRGAPLGAPARSHMHGRHLSRFRLGGSDQCFGAFCLGSGEAGPAGAAEDCLSAIFCPLGKNSRVPQASARPRASSDHIGHSPLGETGLERLSVFSGQELSSSVEDESRLFKCGLLLAQAKYVLGPVLFRVEPGKRPRESGIVPASRNPSGVVHDT